MPVTMIRASHVIAFQDGGHRHLRDGVVVYDGDTIRHVGHSYDGPVDEVIEAPDRVVTPGFINTHAHLSESPLDKSFVEDRGPRQFYLSGLFEFLSARDGAITEAARRASIAYSMPELLRTGTTTIMEIGGHGDVVAEHAARCGIRAYIGQGYRSGRWFTPDGRVVNYEWAEDDGAAAFDAAVRFIERVDGRENGRIKGFLTPMQVDTCSEALLRRSADAARDMRVPLALHVSQSVPEFIEMTHRNGCTPIEWLQSIGFLSERCILGHCIIPGESSWANYHADDIGILADTGANVAHAVWVFARRGIAMESFARYQRRGVNMTIATDTCPQSMIEAMRWTSVVSKIADRRTQVATAADVFNAATLNGAKALGRDDLGRIAPGAKADLLIWRGDSLFMTPLRDPVRNLVFSATAEDLQCSIIDGRVVMRDGVVPGYDLVELGRAVQQGAEAMWAGMQSRDWAGRDIEQLSPSSFPAFTG
ncbi:chlorohydrolase family protein [Roseomonas haemaphysalidis]|uniref:Amidohydrolase family protein n=1 Tax=Roseomonas haemaphysalidis TaxID=2768162 RepID=A0ABS3KT93_9PROT|nr:chlorohydrolase family protein [Roseomonas haemaphysalidis]MBO1080165.1 amidohydrolase family protein [Roseomonas haemaphysalidis]